MSQPTQQPVEFSVNLAVLSPDDQTQISFGISRQNTSSGPLLLIDFVLRTQETSGQFQDRVKLHVSVGPSDTAEAQAMADRGLTMTQLEFLQGPITTRAQALASVADSASGQPVTSDKKLERMVSVVPHLL
jgi:hypothetical protein